MTEADAAIATALPDYDVTDELGRGGMGVVYLARHRRLERDAAIKELIGPLADDPDVRSRFLVEARALAALDHPHVVPIYDYVERDGRCIVVMEALPGGTVWNRFKEQGLTAQASIALVLATCSALEHAHQHGILHRDVKPENLLFSAGGDLKVTDFGIAKVIGGSRTMATIEGSVIGTPAYMAPEQAQGHEMGPAVDVYATACMLYEFLCGRLPFTGDTPMSLVVLRITEDPPDVRTHKPDLPAPIAEAVMRGLARDPEHRTPTAEAFGCDLAAAAVEAWGPDWLSVTGVLVQGSAAIARTATSGHTPYARPGVVPGAGASAFHTGAAGPESVVPTPPSDASPPTAPPTPGAPPPRAGTPVPGTPTAPPVVGDGTIITSGPVAPAPGAAAGNETVAPSGGTVPPPPAGASTGADLAPPPPPPPDLAKAPAAEPPAAAPAPVSVAVRPDDDERPALGFDPDAIDRSQLVALDEVVAERPTPRPALIVAVAAAVVALVLLVVASSGGSPPAAEGQGQLLSVAGTAVRDGEVIELDLTEPITVEGLQGDAVTLELHLAGQPVVVGEAPVEAGVGRVELGAKGRILAGRLDGRIEVDAADGSSYAQPIAVRSTGPWFLSAEGAGVIVVALFCIASAEAQVRRLRRGRNRARANVALVASSFVTGVCLALLTGLVGRTPMGIGAIVAVGVACVVAALAAATASTRAARARKLQRAAARTDREVAR